MSVSTQVTTFSDLYTDLQNRVRSETGITATQNIAKRFINIALHDMHLGTSEHFPWAERRATIVTTKPYTTGTVSITEGSTTLTGSGTAWNTAAPNGNNNMRAGGAVQIDGTNEVYRVASVASDTSATLSSGFSGNLKTGLTTDYSNPGGGEVTVTSTSHGLVAGENLQIVGTTNYNGTFTVQSVTTDTFNITATFASPDDTDKSGTWESRSVAAAAYSYFEDEYALASDFLRPIDQQRFSSGGLPIDLISRTEFRRRYPQNDVMGRPIIGTIVDLAFDADASSPTAPVRKLKLHRVPDGAYQIHYSYITNNLAVSAAGAGQVNLSADTDEPIVPLRYRHAIVLHAAYNWYRDRKDDTRAAEVKNEYADIMIRVTGDQEVGANRPQMRPRLGPYARRARRPWGSGRGRYDVNGSFDRLENN